MDTDVRVIKPEFVRETAMGRSAAECLAINLKRLRKERGLTQIDLAEKAEITQTFLGFLEVQRSWPRASMIKKLADALGVNESELFVDPDLKPNGRAEAARDFLELLSSITVLVGSGVNVTETTDLLHAISKADDVARRQISAVIGAHARASQVGGPTTKGSQAILRKAQSAKKLPGKRS